MTLIDLPTPTTTPTRRPDRPDRPARSGQPWTEECHVELVELVGAGLTLPEVADTAGRQPSTVLPRLRRMLPVDERGCPEHLVLPRLRELLESGDHDWRRAMLKDTPKAPVVRPPAVHRDGVPGLEDDDLLEVADALVRTQARDEDLLGRVRQQVVDRRLGDRLVDRRVRELVRATPTYHHEEEFRMAAEQWVSNGLGGPVGPVGPVGPSWPTAPYGRRDRWDRWDEDEPWLR
ncbi:hypothetical protein [Nocardioides marmoribigeumensis]|uniref:Uncharacterized protein n=1 Tax=Nocardioides marmoribigeumensis TaxID=433649 RepID=A0ABU2C0U1_9ACTN|nr:hypothetical protein [Nocardioides marmoribigeumensis]MDR7364253.1 hypothetical protein [Nocardioides marmoribigeumensis]